MGLGAVLGVVAVLAGGVVVSSPNGFGAAALAGALPDGGVVAGAVLLPNGLAGEALAGGVALLGVENGLAGAVPLAGGVGAGCVLLAFAGGVALGAGVVDKPPNGSSGASLPAPMRGVS